MKKHLQSTISLIMRLLHLLLRSYHFFSARTDLLFFANTAEPDQMPSDKASDQDPHCFPLLLKVHGFDLMLQVNGMKLGKDVFQNSRAKSFITTCTLTKYLGD